MAWKEKQPGASDLVAPATVCVVHKRPPHLHKAWPPGTAISAVEFLRRACRAWESAMTPKDYRAMADQCFQWVHEAKTVDERRAFLKLERAWLQAALDQDEPPPAMPAASRLPSGGARKGALAAWCGAQSPCRCLRRTLVGFWITPIHERCVLKALRQSCDPGHISVPQQAVS